MAADAHPPLRAYLRTLAGALGISQAPILFTLAAAHPTPGAVWRFIYALPVLVALCLLRPTARASFHQSGWLRLAVLSGLFFALDMACFHHSIRLIGAGPATLLANTQVIWVALIGLVFLRERPSARFWLALPALCVGMFLLAGGTHAALPARGDRLGSLLGAGSGLMYAGMLVLLRASQLGRVVRPEAALLVQISVALPLLSALGALEGSLTLPLSWAQHGWLLLLGVGVQALSWILISGGLPQLPGHHGAMILLAQPVASLIWGWWILDQTLEPSRISGALLVLLGIGLPILHEARNGAQRARTMISGERSS